MLMVTGASGNLGRQVVDEPLRRSSALGFRGGDARSASSRARELAASGSKYGASISMTRIPWSRPSSAIEAALDHLNLCAELHPPAAKPERH